MRGSVRLAAIALALALSGCASSSDDSTAAPPDEGIGARGLVSRVELVNDWLSKDQAVEVRWTLSNEGTQTVWLPSWQAPREGELDDDLFEVRLDGLPVRYVGRHYKRAAPLASDLVAIDPGQSLSTVIDLSAVYRTGGSGEYTIVHRDVPLSVFESAAAFELRSNVVTAVRYEAGNDEDFIRKPTGSQDLVSPGYRSCSSSRKTKISSALSQAATYASNAASYLDAGKHNARYTTWFGSYTSSRFSKARAHFDDIRDTIDGEQLVVDCGCTDSAYAYVYPDDPYVIYVCNAFWGTTTSGTDSRAGTLIHELSHFYAVASTDDWAYGQSAAKSLAQSNPSRAVDNADSHEYFAENTPAQN